MKVLVIDDHALIRDALRGVLRELKDDATVLEASNCGQAMRLVDEHADVGLILLDLNLPDRNGFDVLAELRERYPAISTVVLSAFNDRDNVARRWTWAPQLHSEIIHARAHAQCRVSFFRRHLHPPDIWFATTRPSLPRSHWRDAAATFPASRSGPHGPPGGSSLPDDARQGNKAICRALDLAEPTVENHVTIIQSVEGDQRTEAVIAVDALGWDLRPAADS
jgi:CheY-like chemotaxis protein